MIKLCNFIFFCFIFFYQNISYSKKLDSSNFNEKSVYNYFSALVFTLVSLTTIVQVTKMNAGCFLSGFIPIQVYCLLFV